MIYQANCNNWSLSCSVSWKIKTLFTYDLAVDRSMMWFFEIPNRFLFLVLYFDFLIDRRGFCWNRLSRILDCRLFRRRRPIFLFHGCKYEILNEIGECAYGRVYRCRDASNDAIVAVKQIILSDLDEGVPSAIIREVSFLKELNHQNIIR